jgi:hypothetical protein
VNEVVITIRIALPDGAVPIVEYVSSVGAGPPIAAQSQGRPSPLAGPADEPPFPEAPFVEAAPRQDGCPVHHTPWKTVPAGVSKKTGKPYDAFQACSEMGCNERPRRAA